MERFWSKVDRGEPNECWPWTASLSNGYGQFWLAGRMVYAHRVAYELSVGPIPPGLQLDHVRERGCAGGSCCNPAHLEPVTNAENARRGDAGKHMKAKAAARTACPSGHPYDEANTIKDAQGYRRCRTCHLAGRRRRYAEGKRA